MFQRRTQYAPVDNTSEQHILTVLRFHEARLGKIEKHLITTNKQLHNLISVYKSNTKMKSTTTTKNEKKEDNQSFILLKTMMENLTTQVVASQSFMKEIKEVVSNLKNSSASVKKEKPKIKPANDEYYTNHKLLELERDIAKAQLISIGMEPTLERVDEYVERMRRDRKRFLVNETDKPITTAAEKIEKNTTVVSTTEDEDNSEQELEEQAENVVITSTNTFGLDESILAQNINNLHKVKEKVEEEVLEAVEKIPVVKKPRKRRGRPKKKQ